MQSQKFEAAVSMTGKSGDCNSPQRQMKHVADADFMFLPALLIFSDPSNLQKSTNKYMPRWPNENGNEIVSRSKIHAACRCGSTSPPPQTSLIAIAAKEVLFKACDWAWAVTRQGLTTLRLSSCRPPTHQDQISSCPRAPNTHEQELMHLR